MSIDPNTTPERALERAIDLANGIPWEIRTAAERDRTKVNARALFDTGWFSGGQVSAITGAPTHIVRGMAKGKNPRKLGGALAPNTLGRLLALRKRCLSPSARDGLRWSSGVRTLATAIAREGTSPGTIERFTGVPAKRVELWVKAES